MLSSSNVVVAGNGSATGNPRSKVALKPGHSLMDWVRLGHSGVDLTGVGGVLQDVTPEQLAAHGKRNDAWIAVRGRVYNVTHYMDFHPGGDTELMRGVGQDGTELFNQIHPWVNYESLLQKCLVGRLVQSSRTPLLNKAGNFIGKLFTRRASPEVSVSMDWYQQVGTVNLQFFTRGDFPQSRVKLSANHRDLVVNIKLGSFLHVIHLSLEDNILWPCKVYTNYDTGMVEVRMTKKTPAMWNKLGESEDGDGLKAEIYDLMEVVSVSSVTHNTRLITLRHKERVVDTVPIGHSVQVQANIEAGEEVMRNYTPVAAALDDKFLPPSWTEDCLCLMVKRYSEGVMSRHLCDLKPEDTLSVSQSTGSLQSSVMSGKTQICLLAAGTGFTPMVNIILWALRAGKRKRFQKVGLLFFNLTREDILWKDQLSRLANLDTRFMVTHVLSVPDSDWTGLTGHLDLEMLRNLMPDQKNCFGFVCGPRSFRESAVRFLGEMGYPEDLYFVFQG